jgi:hypothetical protein
LGGLLKAKVHSTADLKVEQRVTVGIRPEYIQVKDRPGENIFLSTMDRIAEGVISSNYYFHVNTVGTTRHYAMVILYRLTLLLSRKANQGICICLQSMW